MAPKVISIRPEPITETPAPDDMYGKVCDSRLTKLEEAHKEHTDLIREIHSKVHNGFGTRIENTDRNVRELKVDANVRITDLRTDMDKRFDATDRGLKHINRTAVALLITLLTTLGGIVIVMAIGG